jgi:prepilin-type processing-associated H-X9-DG protein
VGQCANDPAAPCVGAYTAYNNRQYIVTARSRHLGGVNVVMGDGGVHFVSNNISLSTWQALCTPRGAEPVGTDF